MQKDFNMSAEWFRKAADQGNAKAQYRLGMLYSSGEGIAKSIKNAYIWISLAAISSDGSLKKDSISMKKRLSKKLSSVQLEAADKIIDNWTPKKSVNK